MGEYFLCPIQCPYIYRKKMLTRFLSFVSHALAQFGAQFYAHYNLTRSSSAGTCAMYKYDHLFYSDVEHLM